MIIIEIVFDFNYPLSVYTTKYLQTLTYVFFFTGHTSWQSLLNNLKDYFKMFSSNNLFNHHAIHKK